VRGKATEGMKLPGRKVFLKTISSPGCRSSLFFRRISFRIPFGRIMAL
jgi:hypothetical protein